MGGQLTATARRLGLFSSVAVAILIAAYAVTLVAGLMSLESPEQQIGDPMFTLLEILILLLMPAMVAQMVAVHAAAPESARPLALIAVVFIGLLAVVTCGVHFSVLALSRVPAFAALAGHDLIFAFRWPSTVYALDILAWDVLFPIAMLFAAFAFKGGALANSIRALMLVSAALSFAGLAGVATGNMQIRNIGIVGYVGVFLIVAILLAVYFKKRAPVAA